MNLTLPKSILIVDDTPENLHLLGEMLSDQGYRIRSAPSGERALSTVKKERPDLILLDILMPGLDGYEVCRRLKADEQFSAIPIIFISALNEAFDKVIAFSIGAVDYITKPFQIEEVLARIQTHLNMDELRNLLQEQNQQLQEQNRELDSFAQTVAHDLKNPLGVLVGTLDLLRGSEQLTEAEMQEIVGLSIRGAHKLRSIIDELLLLSSVRKEDVVVVPIDMASIVGQALNRLSMMIEQYQGQVIVPDIWPQTLGYAPWIEEVWVNYLSNGLKYGGEPPRLELAAITQPDGLIRMSVKDNGSGLNAASQAKLFTQFTRLDTLRAEGHGLGLSIVRRIMEKLGGQFGVESSTGEGSTFYFALASGESSID